MESQWCGGGGMKGIGTKDKHKISLDTHIRKGAEVGRRFAAEAAGVQKHPRLWAAVRVCESNNRFG